MANSVVEPFTSIGENSMIWSNCTIAHHSTVGSHCWIASNSIISGQAAVKDFVFIGVQCTIVNEVIVEELNILEQDHLSQKIQNQKMCISPEALKSIDLMLSTIQNIF